MNNRTISGWHHVKQTALWLATQSASGVQDCASLAYTIRYPEHTVDTAGYEVPDSAKNTDRQNSIVFNGGRARDEYLPAVLILSSSALQPILKRYIIRQWEVCHLEPHTVATCAFHISEGNHWSLWSHAPPAREGHQVGHGGVEDAGDF